jgi:pSer/pThr/pTyr-binding forkhead associated (FHA) protein
VKAFKVEYIFDDETKTSYVESDSFYIGRSDKVEVVVQGESISRKHLKVFSQDDEIYLVDNASSNGTYINKNKIAAKSPFLYQSDNKISLGDEKFELRIVSVENIPSEKSMEEKEAKKKIKKEFKAVPAEQIAEKEISELDQDELSRKKIQQMRSKAEDEIVELRLNAKEEIKQLKIKTEKKVNLQIQTARVNTLEIEKLNHEKAKLILEEVEEQKLLLVNEIQAMEKETHLLEHRKRKLEQENQVLENNKKSIIDVRTELFENLELLKNKFESKEDELEIMNTEFHEQKELLIKKNSLLKNKFNLFEEEIQGQYAKVELELSEKELYAKNYQNKLNELEDKCKELESEIGGKSIEHEEALEEIKESKQIRINLEEEGDRILALQEKTESEWNNIVLEKDEFEKLKIEINKKIDLERSNLDQEIRSERQSMLDKFTLDTQERERHLANSLKALEGQKQVFKEEMSAAKSENEKDIFELKKDTEAELLRHSEDVESDLKFKRQSIISEAEAQSDSIIRLANEEANVIALKMKALEENIEKQKVSLNEELSTLRKSSEKKCKKIVSEASINLDKSKKELELAKSRSEELRAKTSRDSEKIKEDLLEIIKSDKEKSDAMILAEKEEFAEEMQKEKRDFAEEIQQEKLDFSNLKDQLRAEEKKVHKDILLENQRQAALLRMKDLENAKEERVREAKNTDKRKKHNAEEISRNLSMLVTNKFQEVLKGKDSKDTIDEFKSELEGLVLDVIYNRKTSSNEEVKKIMGFNPDRGKIIQKYWIKISIVSILSFSLIYSIVFHRDFYSTMFKDKVTEAKKEKSAGQAYADKIKSKRLARPVFNPTTNDVYRETYVGNMFYYTHYFKIYNNREFQNRWVIKLDDFATKELNISEEVIVKVVAIESNFINEINEVKEKGILEEFANGEIEKLRAREVETIEKIKKAFGKEEHFNKFVDFRKNFFLEYIQI